MASRQFDSFSCLFGSMRGELPDWLQHPVADRAVRVCFGGDK